MHQRVPDRRRDFRAALGAAAGCQAAYSEKSRPLLPESRVRRERQRGHAGFVPVEGSFRESWLAGAGAGVGSCENAALAEAFLSILCTAGTAVCGTGASDSQEPEGP